jgi:hypothetical protein
LRGIEAFPPRTPQILGQRKTQNSVLLLTDLGRESRGKEPRRAQGYIPHKIPKRKASKSLQENALKIIKKENQEELKQALRNDAETSIHTMMVHTRSSFRPIILPSHKISP